MLKQNFRRVKIVASVGPASRPLEVVKQLIVEGVNVFRLNFSHSSHEEQMESFNNIKRASAELGINVAILADMQGPKLRVGKFKNDQAEIKAGQKFVLDSNPDLGDETRVYLPHPQIFEALKEGDTLLIDDGKLRLVVESFNSNQAVTKVVVGGIISNAKGVNFPSGILKLASLTEKDLKDLDFALNLGVDYIGLSFVQLAADVEHAKSIINGRAKVISKIEKPSAIENISKIVEVSDGIMVARGDLGVEIPTERVPVMQKLIIGECRRQSKPVIVATQMLESMTHAPLPTRAEASDVANAVYDGADAVMLSGETTIGDYPVQTVRMMSNIIKSVEGDPIYWDILETSYNRFVDHYVSSNPEAKVLTVGRAIAKSAKQIADSIDAKVIVSFSSQGTTSNRICHQRPRARVLSMTDNEILYRQLNLNWGTTPLLINKIGSLSEIVEASISWLKENSWVEKGDKVLIVAGVPVGVGGITNSLRVDVVD